MRRQVGGVPKQRPPALQTRALGLSVLIRVQETHQVLSAQQQGPWEPGKEAGGGLRMVVEGAIKFNSTGAKGVLLPWGLTH